MTTKPLEPVSRAPNPLPIETVRDLLGVVRVLFAFHRGKGNHGCARDLRRAGTQLRRALELAIRKGDSEAHAEAWGLANEAITAIGRVQGRPGDDLTAAVQLASARVKERHFKPEDRDARRQARIKRG